jgi:hypothetical protein
MLTTVLARHLQLSHRCTHLKNHGQGQTCRALGPEHLKANHFVLRSDVKHFYASINRFVALKQLAAHIKNR